MWNVKTISRLLEELEMTSDSMKVTSFKGNFILSNDESSTWFKALFKTWTASWRPMLINAVLKPSHVPWSAWNRSHLAIRSHLTIRNHLTIRIFFPRHLPRKLLLKRKLDYPYLLAMSFRSWDPADQPEQSSLNRFVFRLINYKDDFEELNPKTKKFLKSLKNTSKTRYRVITRLSTYRRCWDRIYREVFRRHLRTLLFVYLKYRASAFKINDKII